MKSQLQSTLESLPEPSPEEQHHSEMLGQHILDQIHSANGKIPFDRYMELALYTPHLGYYSSDLQKFGEQGDFITAPEISPMFGYCIAHQCAETLDHLKGGDILEFGAGSGRLAADILTRLASMDQLPDHYMILELSAHLRQRQKTLLEAEHPDLMARIHWIETLPTGFSGMVVANEVIDAMPVSRFRYHQGSIYEQYVSHNRGSFQSAWEPAQSTNLVDRVTSLCEKHKLPDDYESEVNLRAEAWIKALADSLLQGLVLLIDYGYSSREYYHPQRNRGTLNCHYRHRAHPDPFIWPGLQDITSQVDFSSLDTAAMAYGFEHSAFTNQAFFLLGLGLEGLLGESDLDPQQHLQRLQAVKRLTLPNEMGERFKVLGLGKGLKHPPSGFALHRLPL